MKLKKVQIISAFLAAVISLGVYSAPANVVYADSSIGAAGSSAGIAVPSNFTCKTTTTSITLGWDALGGADAYRVYKYDPSSGEYEKYKNVAGNSCSITGLTKGTIYYFKVAALYKSGNSYIEGTLSNSVRVTTKTKSVLPSSNYTGLFDEGNGIIYYYNNGKISSGWQSVGGYSYYFDEKNYNAVTGWLDIGGKSYYFSQTGKMYKDTTISIGGKNYTFNSDGTLNGKRPAYDRLSSDGKKFVDDVMLYIDQFKDPSSVKIIKAHKYVKENSNDPKGYNWSGYWLNISATNSFNSRSTKSYQLVMKLGDINLKIRALGADTYDHYGFTQTHFFTASGDPSDINDYHSFDDELDLINDAISERLSVMGY